MRKSLTSLSDCIAEAGPSARWTRAVWFAGLVALLGWLACPHSAAGEVVTTDANKVKAAFLRNFAHYVTWPTTNTADSHAPWHIGVLGADSFGDVLEKTFAGRIEQGRAFTVHHAETLAALPPCEIIYIVETDVQKRQAMLAALKNVPVLTVGDAPGFLQEGGIIRFHVGNHVEMSINLDQAHFVALKIPSQMLEVSHEVLENGAVHKLR